MGLNGGRRLKFNLVDTGRQLNIFELVYGIDPAGAVDVRVDDKTPDHC